MANRYQSRRVARGLARKSSRSFIITLILVGLLVYATFSWVLPFFINSVGVVKSVIKPAQKVAVQASQNAAIAPPVFNIPFEATNSAQINISGFGTPGSKVKLYIDDESKQTVGVSGNGSFSFENIDLSLGTNNIYGTTMDDNGKESLPSKTVKITYDNEKPALTISEPDDNKIIQGGDKKVKVSAKTDPNINVFVNGTQVIVDKDGNFNIEQPLNDGDNTISIKAVDQANNTTEIQRKVTYNP